MNNNDKITTKELRKRLLEYFHVFGNSDNALLNKIEEDASRMNQCHKTLFDYLLEDESDV